MMGAGGSLVFMFGKEFIDCSRDGKCSSPGAGVAATTRDLLFRERGGRSSECSASDSSKNDDPSRSSAVLTLVPRLRDGVGGGGITRLSRSRGGTRGALDARSDEVVEPYARGRASSSGTS